MQGQDAGDTVKRLDKADLPARPQQIFNDLYRRVCGQTSLISPAVMSLATSGPDDEGPSVRTVIMKRFNEDEGTIEFVSSSNSPKGRRFLILISLFLYQSNAGEAMERNPTVEALFLWNYPPTIYQVRVHGKAVKSSAEETARYFSELPESWKAGLWAFRQSEEVGSLEEQTRRVNEGLETHTGEWEVPSTWSAYKIVPESFDFYFGHGLFPAVDRFKYLRRSPDRDEWDLVRLCP